MSLYSINSFEFCLANATSTRQKTLNQHW